MASGDVCGLIQAISPPSTLFAPYGTRVGGSTPAEQVPFYAFDAATAWYLDYYCTLVGYAGGGLTITLKGMAATATTGNCIMRAAIRRVLDDGDDVDVSHTYDYNSVTFAAPSATGEFTYDDITFTSGADMDSLVNGEDFILRIGRDAANGSDTMAGNYQMVSVVITES